MSKYKMTIDKIMKGKYKNKPFKYEKKRWDITIGIWNPATMKIKVGEHCIKRGSVILLHVTNEMNLIKRSIMLN